MSIGKQELTFWRSIVPLKHGQLFNSEQSVFEPNTNETLNLPNMLLLQLTFLSFITKVT